LKAAAAQNPLLLNRGRVDRYSEHFSFSNPDISRLKPPHFSKAIGVPIGGL
jgi:hypothetical protein